MNAPVDMDVAMDMNVADAAPDMNADMSTALPAIAQQAYVKASNTGGGDQFGGSVAFSADGNTLVIGAYNESSNGSESDDSAPESGAVYVFTRSGGTWTQRAYIKASNAESFDEFGSSLALSSDGATLAIGAIGEDSAATGIRGSESDNSAFTSGAVYVFAYGSTTWTQQAYVKASNTAASDRFGSSVALSTDGSTLAVGAHTEASSAVGIGGDQSSNAAGSSGAAYVFTRSGILWTQQAYVKASNTGAGDQLGGSIALARNGDMLAIGARYESGNGRGLSGDPMDDSAGNSGAVYILMRSAGAWTQTVYLKASNTEAEDNFGYSVALASDGSALAVGAFLEASNATGIDGDQANNAYMSSGAVYRFLYSGLTTWSQSYVKASNTNTGDTFGYAVALSSDGTTLAVGAAGEDSSATGIGGNQLNNDATESGATYLFYGR